MEHEELTQKVIGCTMTVHCTLWPGFLESVYQNALAHEVQLVNYLIATGIEIGLLLDFGTAPLEFKRKTRTHQPKQTG